LAAGVLMVAGGEHGGAEEQIAEFIEFGVGGIEGIEVVAFTGVMDAA
jgi:hypothetical protein